LNRALVDIVNAQNAAVADALVLLPLVGAQPKWRGLPPVSSRSKMRQNGSEHRYF
jgi:hypothetical protein